MAARGRPRVHPPNMSAAEVKRAWDRKMRNVDGSVPGEPKRKPCVIYLSDEARAVMHDELKAAQELKISPVLTSRLIEDLLRAHVAEPLRHKRAGLHEETLRQRIAAVKMVAEENKIRARKYDEYVHRKDYQAAYRPNVRTIRRLVEADFNRPKPTHADVAELFRRIQAHMSGQLLDQLIDGLRPLFESRGAKNELRIKVLRRLEEYFDALLQSNAANETAKLNWSRVRNSLD